MESPRPLSQDSSNTLPAPPPGREGWPFTAEPRPPSDRERQWPRISIVIPSFNQGAFLEEALRSVLLQGYPDLEVLVFDGGSQDATVSILRRYERHLASWVSEPDGGQSDAINRGFARATGEILTFFGTDDLYLPGAFFDAAARFDENPGAGAVVGAFRFMDEASALNDEIHPPRLPSRQPVDLSLADPTSWRLHQVSTFYRTTALDAVGRHVDPDLRYTMDRELLWRVGRQFPIALAEPVYAAFRRHSTSKSVSEILPFCFEMARLHLMAPADEELATGRIRQRWARFWRARGHLKVAEATTGRSEAISSLLAAVKHRPKWLSSRGYFRLWRRALALGARPAPDRPSREGRS